LPVLIISTYIQSAHTTHIVVMLLLAPCWVWYAACDPAPPATRLEYSESRLWFRACRGRRKVESHRLSLHTIWWVNVMVGGSSTLSYLSNYTCKLLRNRIRGRNWSWLPGAAPLPTGTAQQIWRGRWGNRSCLENPRDRSLSPGCRILSWAWYDSLIHLQTFAILRILNPDRPLERGRCDPHRKPCVSFHRQWDLMAR